MPVVPPPPPMHPARHGFSTLGPFKADRRGADELLWGDHSFYAVSMPGVRCRSCLVC